MQMLQIGFLVVSVPYWDWDNLTEDKSISEEEATQVKQIFTSHTF